MEEALLYTGIPNSQICVVSSYKPTFMKVKGHLFDKKCPLHSTCACSQGDLPAWLDPSTSPRSLHSLNACTVEIESKCPLN